MWLCATTTPRARILGDSQENENQTRTTSQFAQLLSVLGFCLLYKVTMYGYYKALLSFFNIYLDFGGHMLLKAHECVVVIKVGPRRGPWCDPLTVSL